MSDTEVVIAGEPTALYRYFDEDDILLYVGISKNLATRETAHIKGSRWIELAARSTIERYPSRPAAGDAEVKAIKTEHPIFNVQHNDTPEARERFKQYLEKHGGEEAFMKPPGAVSTLPLYATPTATGTSVGVQRKAQTVRPSPRRDPGSSVPASPSPRTRAHRSYRIKVSTDTDPGLARLVSLDVIADDEEYAEVLLYPEDARGLADALRRHADLAEQVNPRRANRTIVTTFTEHVNGSSAA